MAALPLAFRGSESVRNGYMSRTLLGVPKKREQMTIGYLSLAFSGARKWAEQLRNPCVLTGTPESGTKSELATAPAHHSLGPESGRNGYVTRAFSRVPQKRGQNENCLPRRRLLEGPK